MNIFNCTLNRIVLVNFMCLATVENNFKNELGAHSGSSHRHHSNISHGRDCHYPEDDETTRG